MKFVLINIFLLISSHAYSNLDHLKYDKNKAVGLNESLFLKNLKFDCDNKGYLRKDKEISPVDILSTYPAPLAFYFLEKNIKTICYYGFSRAVKYLASELKEKTESLLVNTINKCLENQESFKLCEGLGDMSSLYDSTILLSQFCTPSTLKTFKQVNCKFKKVANKKCDLYTGMGKPLEECPFYYSNKRDINELYKTYYSSSCKQRYKWRAPKCLN